MAELLERVRDGWNTEGAENLEREERFTRERDNQVELLERAKATRAYEEQRSERLEDRFGAMELELAAPTEGASDYAAEAAKGAQAALAAWQDSKPRAG